MLKTENLQTQVTYKWTRPPLHFAAVSCVSQEHFVEQELTTEDAEETEGNPEVKKCAGILPYLGVLWV